MWVECMWECAHSQESVDLSLAYRTALETSHPLSCAVLTLPALGTFTFLPGAVSGGVTLLITKTHFQNG